MKIISYLFPFLIILLLVLAGCSQKAHGLDIKDDFCGVHINYQYCKCAFHNEFCDAVGMNKNEADTYVHAKYYSWLNGQINKGEYGIIEKDKILYLNSKPGEVLEIKTDDLPRWARGQLATIGALITTNCPPDEIIEGDNDVLLNGLPIARKGDGTKDGGTIIDGSRNIFVNGQPAAIIGGHTTDPLIIGTVPCVGGRIISNAN